MIIAPMASVIGSIVGASPPSPSGSFASTVIGGPLAGVNVKLFISQESQQAHYREEGMAVLAAPRKRLAEAGIACEFHIGVGDPGQVIVEYAGSKHCDEVVMGTHGRGFLGGVVMGSVAQRVVQLASMPVVLVK